MAGAMLCKFAVGCALKFVSIFINVYWMMDVESAAGQLSASADTLQVLLEVAMCLRGMMYVQHGLHGHASALHRIILMLQPQLQDYCGHG